MSRYWEYRDNNSVGSPRYVPILGVSRQQMSRLLKICPDTRSIETTIQWEAQDKSRYWEYRDSKRVGSPRYVPILRVSRQQFSGKPKISPDTRSIETANEPEAQDKSRYWEYRDNNSVGSPSYVPILRVSRQQKSGKPKICPDTGSIETTKEWEAQDMSRY